MVGAQADRGEEGPRADDHGIVAATTAGKGKKMVVVMVISRDVP